MSVEQPCRHEDAALILVDGDDNIVGHLDKDRCHDGDGRLHRAFSVFLFDADGRPLLQQRARGKRLWPLAWSNSVCSHPTRGESVEGAAHRRVLEELGVEVALQVLYHFEYRARDGARGVEHELCWVLAGRICATEIARLRPDESEIAALRWIDREALDRELGAEPERFTPWLRLEWRALRGDQRDALARALADDGSPAR